MVWLTKVLRTLAALAIIAALSSSLSILAEENGRQSDDPSPATRHAQVIAHGVTTMPAAEVGWRAVTARALPPGRATAEMQAAGFLVAHDGTIGLVDAQGIVLTRIAPGEAVWVDPAQTAAVVSLEKKAAEYIEIALLPAANLGAGGLSLAIGLPFAAPPGEAFDIDLVRDVLVRTEETTIPGGVAPALLVVTRGAVWVTSSSGETVQLTAGAIGQIEGDTVIAGASREPASFVVARIGPEVPERFSLRDGAGAATPEPRGAPAGIPEPTSERLWPEPTPVDVTRDIDADGLTDNDESTLYGTEARDPDTDDDGIVDGEEILTHATNPFLADTDGDGVADRDEIDAGTDPLDVASLLETPLPSPEATPATENPGGSPPDSEVGPEPEASPATDPDAAAERDLDGDGLSTTDEINLYGTNPAVVDSDGDGFSDGGEVVSGRDPLDPAA